MCVFNLLQWAGWKSTAYQISTEWFYILNFTHFNSLLVYSLSPFDNKCIFVDWFHHVCIEYNILIDCSSVNESTQSIVFILLLFLFLFNFFLTVFWTIVNAVIGLCGAQNSSIVGELIVCVFDTFQCGRKKCTWTVWCWTVVNRMFRTATTTFGSEHQFLPILKCCFLDTISFSTNTYTPYVHLNHWLYSIETSVKMFFDIRTQFGSYYIFSVKFNEKKMHTTMKIYFSFHIFTRVKSHISQKKFIIFYNSIIW